MRQNKKLVQLYSVLTLYFTGNIITLDTNDHPILFAVESYYEMTLTAMHLSSISCARQFKPLLSTPLDYVGFGWNP